VLPWLLHRPGPATPISTPMYSHKKEKKIKNKTLCPQRAYILVGETDNKK